jgi:rhamnose transport system ATP-binding protein
VSTILLAAAHLAKSYVGVHALRDASFELRAGEVHALVGENGAGKSTLIKILAGVIEPDAGELYVRGERVTQHSPRTARARGIAAMHQQPTLFTALSVAENIALASEAVGSWRHIDWGVRRQRAAELLARVGAHIDPDAEAGTLSMPEQQLVEIARALGAHASILVLDEPTASLTDADARRLFNVVAQLRADRVGLIYISHRLEELGDIADRVTVMRDGRTVETRAMSEVSRDELVRLMVGRELSAAYPTRANVSRGGPSRLALRNVECAAASVHDISLSIHAGETVGLAGLVGSGRTGLARVLFGITPADAGEIRIDGEPVILRSPRDAIRHGVAYLPEDRRRHGVIPGMPIDANITLASLDRLARHGTLDVAAEKSVAMDYVERLGVKTHALHAAVETLSGGNQQKVALARWLATAPRVLIIDEPTQGIDIGAKAEIHELIARVAADGAAILLISSDLPEVIGLSDRVVVMAAGRIVDVFDHADATQESIMHAALELATA